MYDYGIDAQNLKAYNQTTPPYYPVENLKERLAEVDMLLIWGSCDSMINLTDLHMLLSILPE